MILLALLWYVCVFVQSLLGLGTAYRLTKNGGDNGVALWGWLFLMNLVALIPGLGFYLWHKYRDADNVATRSAMSKPQWVSDEGARNIPNSGKPQWMIDEEKKGSSWRDNIY